MTFGEEMPMQSKKMNKNDRILEGNCCEFLELVRNDETGSICCAGSVLMRDSISVGIRGLIAFLIRGDEVLFMCLLLLFTELMRIRFISSPLTLHELPGQPAKNRT